MRNGLKMVRNALVILALLTMGSPEKAQARNCDMYEDSEMICETCNWGHCWSSWCEYDDGGATMITTCPN